MAEADDESSLPDAGDADGGDSAGQSSGAEEVSVEEAAAARGPGFLSRALPWLFRWHPLIFLGASLAMAVTAWMVYPEPQTREIPPARPLYESGLDHLYRVFNPDLPLLADTAFDEALAARNDLMNLFIFHRAALNQYPDFINPHLLLGEANRILAEFNPAMATKYYQDAAAAYADAALWENREDDAWRLAEYVRSNFLDSGGMGGPTADAADPIALFEEHDEEIALRRARRNEYIRYRIAEADVHLDHPDLARPVLEEIQREADRRRRESMRIGSAGEPGVGDAAGHAFELGGDEYRQLDLLLARAYDGLGRLDSAASWYLRYLTEVPESRSHAFVMERLAAIAMGNGEVYRKVDTATASRHFATAVEYYGHLLDSSSATAEQRRTAIRGLAAANSRLASLVPEGALTGVDRISELGRTVRGWLEDFSGQPLPRRTLAIPGAVGSLLSKPELVLPGGAAIPGIASGTLLSMAGGGAVTPHETRRRFLIEALRNYDILAIEALRNYDILAAGGDAFAGNEARLRAAWESLRLGRSEDAAARFQRLLDPLAGEELAAAARLGLATIALERGDLRRAAMLVLGGYLHPMPLWFVPSDADWRRIAALLGNPAGRRQPGALRRIWETIPEEGRAVAEYAASGRRLDDEYVRRFLRALNTMLRRPDFYQPADFPEDGRNFHLSYLLSRNPELLTAEDVVWRNRLLLEEAWPYDLSQRAAKGNVGFESLPPGRELPPGGLVEPERVRDILVRLARAWRAAAETTPSLDERLRTSLESVAAYRAAIERYGGDPGELHYELGAMYEALAEIREVQGDHLEALSLTAAAARSYLDVSLKARGTPREMDALLLAGDAFFRAGLLERAVESQNRFMERFGYASPAGSENALSVVRAENLLGRARWFLGDSEGALESFKRNIPRRTPDRFKSIYYVGRVMLDEGVARGRPELLGDAAKPLPDLDRNGDPVIESALQAFNFLRQSPGINPTARAWRWSTFDLAHLKYLFAERARRAAEEANAADGAQPAWLALYDDARLALTEALERYPLRRNGGIGLSVRVEPEDYADVMASRFEAEYALANTLRILADARRDEALAALARAHLENLRDRTRYADALFDTSLDRFQLNAAVVREEIEGGGWDRSLPLPRSRLGDDEGPTHSPEQLRTMLRNSMQLLADAYFQAGERVRRGPALAMDGNGGPVPDEAAAFYRRAYEVQQGLYDRFGTEFGPQAMVGMGDALSRLGLRDEAANHYRMAKNMADLLPPDARPEGGLDLGPTFWGEVAVNRVRDLEGGYATP